MKILGNTGFESYEESYIGGELVKRVWGKGNIRIKETISSDELELYVDNKFLFKFKIIK